MSYIEKFHFSKKMYDEHANEFVPKEVQGLQLNTLSMPKISDIINLLEEAKKQFGDVPMMFDDCNGCAGGFTSVYLSPDEHFPKEGQDFEATCRFLFY